MKFEKKVALKALRSMHADHVNFSKTLLKNMNSYLHSTTKAEDHFKKVVEILPLQTERMTMESLEIYLAILNKIANDVILHSHKKGNSVKKRRRVTIIKIVLTCLLECASNFPILREYIFNTVVNYCKKAIETKLEVATVMTDFIGIYLCKFATSLEEKCFKTSLELFYTFTQEEKKLLRILYTIHANFPSFFENTRTSAFMKEKIRPIKYENFDPAFMFNSELYRIDIFVEDLEAICKNFSSMKAEQVKIKNYFIFVNLFCFKKKLQLASIEERLVQSLLLFFSKLLKEGSFELLQTFVILLTFFASAISTLDKKTLSHLSASKEDSFHSSHSEHRKIAIIMLTSGMPRSSSYFLYKPRKDSKRIKFFTYFDCCKRLASIKANKKSYAEGTGEELRRMIIVFASLREFKFAEEYLSVLVEILGEIHNIITAYLSEDKKGSPCTNLQAGPSQRNQSSQTSSCVQMSPPMNSNQLAVAIITGSISPTKIPLSNGYPSAINKSVLLSLEKLQSLISRLTTVADHFLENDQISKQALKSFVALLKIVFKYLENYERLDLAIVKKIRQSLHDFLVPKSQIFGAELYLIFKAKKLLALIDSAIDRSMNISDAKTSLLKYIQDLDLVLLPKRIFISSKTPMVELTQTFLWQFDDKTKVSSLKEHIIECEVAVKNVQDQPIESLTVEAELKASECLFDQIKFVKKSIKEAKSLVSFQYLVHLESICKHKLEFSVRLVSSAGFLLDRIETKEFVEVV